jgi:hypothetical protein
MSIWNKRDEIVMGMHGRKADGTPRKCQVCGKEPHAMWVGAEVITVCRGCAETILPALMADAVFLSSMVPEKKTMDTLKTHWNLANAHYWRSIANNFANAQKKNHPVTEDDFEKTATFPAEGDGEGDLDE